MKNILKILIFALIMPHFAFADEPVKFTLEGATRYSVGNEDYKGAQVDATELGALFNVTQDIRGKTLGAFQFLCNVDKSVASCPKDWDHFFREGYVEINLQKIIDNPNSTLLVGRMMIESATSDSELMIDNNAPLFAMTRVRTAYAVQVQINPKNAFVDHVDIAAINTGPNDSDVQADTVSHNAPGGIIHLSKKIYDRLTLDIGLTHIKYKPHTEDQINLSAKYQLTDELKIFANTAYTTYSPYYGNAHTAVTLGLAHENEIGVSDIEVSNVQNEFNQLAIGYRWKVTPTVTLGVEARHNWCYQNALVCARSNTRGTFEIHYLLDQIEDKTVGRSYDMCAVGDPGCHKTWVRPLTNKK